VLDVVHALCEAGDLVTARSVLPRLDGFAASAELEFVRGRVALSELQIATAERHLQAAWTARPEEDRRLGVWIASELAGCAYFRVDAHGHLEWARRAMELTSEADADTGPAASKLALALGMAGRLEDGLSILDRQIASDSSASRDLTLHALCRGRLRLIADDLPGARTDLLDVATETIRRGSSRSAALALGRLSLVEYYRGRWDVALAHADQGLAACVDRTDVAQLTAVRTPAVLVLAARGTWPAAEHHLEAMRLEDGDATLPAVYTAVAAAHLAGAMGDAGAVVSALSPILTLNERDAVDEPGFWPWQNLYADALVDLGQLDEAEQFLTRHELIACDRGRRSMIARLARARARMEAARGRETLAHDAFSVSSGILGDLSMPYELAMTELAHAQFLRRRRQRRAAAETLANARDRFAALGAYPALERCERELEATGLAPNRPTAKGAKRLTPQELTVARLVLAGMTNREIAGELMLSIKTVEVHLTRIYAKLDVASRTQLRARARKGELEMLSDRD
jgi:DNA-binding CsgD family transcriptional regulator/tetratricopeptide (TPR) repeat protein